MKSRPNILLILTDQHRLSAIGSYGNTPCQTPNLDRLAAEGIRFETAYTSCPVCSPARASIMTGRYPHQHGICSNVHNLGCCVHELPDSPQLLSRRLLQAGYVCGYTGKWHLGTDSNRAYGSPVSPSLPGNVGFDGQNFPGHGGGGFNYPEYKAYLKDNGYTHEVTHADGVSCLPICSGVEYGILTGTEESTVPYFLADHTLSLIDTYSKDDNPFFIWHNFWGPHGPYYIPEEYFEIYRNIDIPHWPNYLWEEAEANAPRQVKLHPRRNRLAWKDWADAIRHYYAFTTLIDRQIGRILDHLRSSGLLENTLVIFTADHGETLGSHGGLTDKGWQHFEEIQRIPFIVRPPDAWSSAERGTVRREWASLLDVYPSILDAAGIESGSGNPGMSLLPLLRNKSVTWRDSVVIEFHGVNNLATSMLTLRKGHLKYGWNCSSQDELYNLQSDPWEMTNLAADRAHADTLREMRILLRDWMKETRYPGIGMYEQSRIPE